MTLNLVKENFMINTITINLIPGYVLVYMMVNTKHSPCIMPVFVYIMLNTKPSPSYIMVDTMTLNLVKENFMINTMHHNKPSPSIYVMINNMIQNLAGLTKLLAYT